MNNTAAALCWGSAPGSNTPLLVEHERSVQIVSLPMRMYSVVKADQSSDGQDCDDKRIHEEDLQSYF